MKRPPFFHDRKRKLHLERGRTMYSETLTLKTRRVCRRWGMSLCGWKLSAENESSHACVIEKQLSLSSAFSSEELEGDTLRSSVFKYSKSNGLIMKWQISSLTVWWWWWWWCPPYSAYRWFIYTLYCFEINVPLWRVFSPCNLKHDYWYAAILSTCQTF